MNKQIIFENTLINKNNLSDKKKGFTLIELLGVIVVIGIILMITMFIIPNLMDGVYKRTCKINEGMMEKAALNYYSLGKDNLPSKEGESKEVTLEKLITSKSIKEIKDPKTKEVCSRQGSKSILTFVNGTIIQKTNLNCSTCMGEQGNSELGDEELWDGWIKLTLYYPESSVMRKWRLGEEGEVRNDPMIHWQDYTGPITIPLNRVEDIWISYKIGNEEFIIPPAGKLLVDIVPDKIGRPYVKEVNVKINFDKDVDVKEYRVGDSGWMNYEGPFKVTENTIVEARAKKTEDVYDQDGNKLMTRNIAGRDIIYINNIGVEEADLEAPTIERLPANDSNEVARVRITYPGIANKKIYKLNYGIERNYSEEISIQNYGTHVVGYYYDSSNKRSKARSIVINDTTKEPALPPTDYKPNKPGSGGNGSIPPINNWVPAPTISINPSGGRVDEVEVSVNAPANADDVYIKLGIYGTYQKYTMPLIVRENMTVYAYYKTYEGYRSDTGYGYVRNIKVPGKPYVYIGAVPYPNGYNYGQKEVKISIEFDDSNINEYSLDGLVYKPYNGSFTMTNNGRVYAKGTNDNGITETYLDINNIGDLTPPPTIKKLDVSINAMPEPSLSTTRVDEVKVTIDYDKNATGKYYRIGRGGSLQEYKGQFTVKSNTTIYAYATGVNAKGETSKNIDNLLRGITDPIIRAYPSSGSIYEVDISIEYDKYASIKRYSINNGPLRDYVNSFKVSENGTIITAYSANKDGEWSESTYVVGNIVAKPPVLIVDKGMYFILKLNFPPLSTGREYKWKANGLWTTYKNDGIMLIKPQYKDEIIKSGTIIKIEDENGKLVTFNGDYYLIDVPISEILENLHMRWDKETPPTPQIILSTTEPAKEVSVSILYDKTIINKEYKIVTRDGQSSGWLPYTKPFKVDKKDTAIYARGLNSSEVWSNEAIKKITNIDDEDPTIVVTGDLETAQQKVSLRVVAKDDTKVALVKWASGIRNEKYFNKSGKEILNNSIVIVTENGDYTFYVEDQVGNNKVVTVKVTNIDNAPPKIDIEITPEDKVGIDAIVSIEYNDSITKQYKVGTSNPTWITYTGSFTIDSYNILTKKWENEDGTVTIYAKGKDEAGNEITVSKKVYNLDLDMPKTPVITSNYGYPTLTSYGVVFDGTTTIKYDDRKDIKNEYSVDNGTTWNEYKGEFQAMVGIVKARSIKLGTGLKEEVTKAINMPADAIGPEAYDGDDATYVDGSGGKLMQIDGSIVGENIIFTWYFNGNYGGATTQYLVILDENKNVISSISRTSGTHTITMPVPQNARWIRYNGYPTSRLYEIQPSSEPTFNATNGYMLLHADPIKAIRNPYQIVSINYFPTSVEKLYRIGTTGEWQVYKNQPIKVNQGETIYAKGVDKHGNETKIISQYTSSVIDALGAEAYDGDDTTYVDGSGGKLMQIDGSIVGKNIIFTWYFNGNYGGSTTQYLRILDENKNVISSISRTSGTHTITMPVPQNARWIRYNGYPTSRLYEIKPNNIVTITPNNTSLTNQNVSVTIKPLLQNDKVKYSFDNITWFDYSSPVVITENKKLYAKSINSLNQETPVQEISITNIDKTPPELNIDGELKITVDNFELLDLMKGVTATDANGIKKITTNGNLSRLPGVYEVNYIAEDNAGNITTKKRIVRVLGSEDITVYVSPTGNDSAGNGSFEKPYQTLDLALSEVVDEGIIYILGKIEIPVRKIYDFDIIKKNVTFKGDYLKYGSTFEGEINIYGRNYEINFIGLYINNILPGTWSELFVYSNNINVYNSIFNEQYTGYSNVYYPDGFYFENSLILRMGLIYHRTKFKNCAFKTTVSGATIFENSLFNVTYDEYFNITSDGWRDAGIDSSGNPTNIGLYGGRYPWQK